ncbi:MAG: DNA repair protein RecN [Desulfobulbaceae bacterium]|nr:DNA repair protein RecN [Desulfobulbaceae bacterium]
MLKEIRIENLALIESLHVVLAGGLTVFTGETGAGKSIILQAIALLTGGRASSSWIRTGASQAIVEALFDCPKSLILRRELQEMGVEVADELLIKRLFSVDGKSRFYLNGGLATSRLIQSVSEHLVSVASQHDHQQLLNARYHLDFIDMVGELWPERERVSALFDQWSAVRNELDSLKKREMEKEQRRDFLSYQCREIEVASIEIGEDARLASDRMRLKSSADLQKVGQKCYRQLLNASESLALARKDIEAMSALDPEVSPLASGVVEQSFLVEEYTGQVRDYINQLPNDEAALDEIAARITLLQQLKRKYGEDLAEILAYAEKARFELQELEQMDEKIAKLSECCRSLEHDLVDVADALSTARGKVAETLCAAIKEELRQLSFEQAEFQALFKDAERRSLDSMTKTGWDRCEFMFSANPGEPVKPLVKIASGGELSRVMLALKCLLAKQDSVETVIFDEIDSGIGGKAAESVARKIKELARHHQVVCITHLPQIAACGTSHFLVEKHLAAGRTATSISQLGHDARQGEIARMLDGDSVSSQTLAFAAELIGRNQ